MESIKAISDQIDLYYQAEISDLKNPYLQISQEKAKHQQKDIMLRKLHLNQVIYILKYLDVKDLVVFAQMSRNWRRILHLTLQTLLYDVHQLRNSLLTHIAQIDKKKSTYSLFVRDLQRKSEIIQLLGTLPPLSANQVQQFLSMAREQYEDIEPGFQIKYSNELKSQDLYTIQVLFNVAEEKQDHKKLSVLQQVDRAEVSLDKIVQALNSISYQSIKHKIYVYDKINEFFDGFVFCNLQKNLNQFYVQYRVLMWLSVQCFYHIYQIQDLGYLKRFINTTADLEQYSAQYKRYSRLSDRYGQVLSFLPQKVNMLDKLKKNTMQYILSFLSTKDVLNLKVAGKQVNRFMNQYHQEMIENLSIYMLNHSDTLQKLDPTQFQQIMFLVQCFKQVGQFDVSQLIIYKQYSNIKDKVMRVICTAMNMTICQENFNKKGLSNLQLVEYDGQKLSTTYLRDQILLETVVKYIRRSQKVDAKVLDKATSWEMLHIIQTTHYIDRFAELKDNMPLLWILMNHIQDILPPALIKESVEYFRAEQQLKFHKRYVKM